MQLSFNTDGRNKRSCKQVHLYFLLIFPYCIGFLQLYSTTNRIAHSNGNLFSHSSGCQRSEIQASTELVPLEVLEGNLSQASWLLVTAASLALLGWWRHYSSFCLHLHVHLPCMCVFTCLSS